MRWLAVGLLAHVVATYVGEGTLYWSDPGGRGLELIRATTSGSVTSWPGCWACSPTRFATVPLVYLTSLVALVGIALAADPDFTAIATSPRFWSGSRAAR